MTLPPGTRVRMSAALQERMREHSPDHIAEFGDCVGRVEGPVDYNTPGTAYDPSKLGPEVDVRWQPSNLRYGYYPEELVVLPMIIAIDGPAASGKGTLAKRLAAHLGFHVLDTGLLYRAVARDIERCGFRLDDRWAALAAARSLNPATLDDPALRGVPAGDKASVIAKIPEVRAALLQYQRDFAGQSPGAVLDGRDIGTVVCPNADIKIYVTATPEERARRRHLEHQARGEPATYDDLLADIRSRDARDSSRAIAPLAAAEDAITIDTTTMDADAVFATAVRIISR